MRVKPLQMGLMPLYERYPKELPWHFPPYEEKARIQLSMNQDAGPHQTLTESVDSLILDFSVYQNCEKEISGIYKLPSLW